MGILLNKTKDRGFTLLELMVTVAIAAILATVVMPSFTGSILGNRLTTYNNELLAALNLARSEAIKRNLPVSVIRTGANWENGWNVITDLNEDGAQNGTDILIRTYAALPASFTLRGTTPGFLNRITYQAIGSSGNGSFVLCDNSDGNNVPEANTSKMIIVSITGRAMTAGDNDNDGIPNKNDGTEIVSCTVSPF